MAKASVSILSPVYNPPEGALRACVASVRGQSDDRWEWCVVDDASTAPHVRPILEQAARADPRIKVLFHPENRGIVAATNDALRMASGDIVAFLDHDDELSADAVAALVETFNDPTVGIAYSDEDVIDEHGALIAHYDKPDFSPERLRSHNYFAHLVATRRDYAVASGGLRQGFDGAQDNDFDLRAVEHFGSATHIPRRLYRWRAVAGSVAADPAAKPSTLFSAERALREHLERVGIDATTSEVPRLYFSFRLHRAISGRPTVALLVAGPRSTPAVGETVVRTDHSAVRVVELGDGRLVEEIETAIATHRPDVFIVLTEGARLHHGSLIDELVPLALSEGVAAAGPSLYDGCGHLVASGFAGIDGPTPVGSGEHEDAVGPWGMYGVTREVDALSVHGLCMSRAVYDQVGDVIHDIRGLARSTRERDWRLLVSPFTGLVVAAAHEERLNTGVGARSGRPDAR